MDPKLRALVLAMGLLLFAGVPPVLAQEKGERELKFKGAEIEGKREKPKDIYILPWQKTSLLKESSGEMNFVPGGDATMDLYRLRQERAYAERVGQFPQSK